MYNFFMEIYIEIFIFQNILINMCLLKLVYLTTKSITCFFKLLLASLIGTIPSIICQTLISNVWLLNLTKISTALIMISLAFKQSKKQFLFNFILMFIYTYTFGGLIISLNSNTYFTEFGVVTASKYSLEAICVIFLIFTYIFEKVAKQIKLKIQTGNLIFPTKVTLNNRSIKINSYLDTGNFLNHDGQPVLLLDLQSYLRLTKTNLIEFLSKKSQSIETKTVSGNNQLKLFKVEKIEIKTNKKTLLFNDVFIAINATNCFKNANYQALISPLFL